MEGFEALRLKNIALSSSDVRASVGPDQLIINAVSNVEELQRVVNSLSKRLKEWYGNYLPELERSVADNHDFVLKVLESSKSELIQEYDIESTMGADLDNHDVEAMLGFATSIKALFDEEKKLVEYLESMVKARAPNVHLLCGAVIGAKLLRGAGSLKDLALMRSSTVQLIGAEKALFRHIRTGAKPPKYGYLMQHPFVQRAAKQDKGKMARSLADKISIAARVDYFKGQFVADRLLKELEVRLK